jgi:hypothetical protein
MKEEQLTAVECLGDAIDRIIETYDVDMMRYPLEKAYEKAKVMEREQREKDFIAGYKKRAELSNLIYDEASELSAKELFKQQEQWKYFL